ncbi:MAG TPA: PSD1 and planctomycete cytochrome C domain-containing protein [Gemmataceae bacterium]|nr:PSD1 and planctomycete cytochrome C domain-containing protein [Gemmataceae bacterium]
MRRSPLSWLPLLIVVEAALAASSPILGQDPDFFERKIRPVLVEHCYRCHSAEAAKAGKLKGKLRLDTRAGIRAGGETGPAIVPNDVAKSLLIAALRYQTLEMPPRGKLPEPIIADFVRWVEQGAIDPRKDSGTVAAKRIDIEKGRTFWAFQPPRTHPRPTVHRTDWPAQELDWFVLAEMEKRGLTPVRPASRHEWIRRATLDVIGLPPTPDEVDAFEKDDRPGAEARVVDRLLASPHYGERWGRYWLDLARYTDDLGGTVEPVPALNAYRYRDWVVQALNRDLPYDQFVRQQIAGDLIAEPASDAAERLVALGFQGLGQRFSGNAVGMVKMKIADELDDRVDTVSRSLLGLTISCARCHDHKFDPIPQVDYYSLAAAYNGAELSAERPISPPDVVHAYETWSKESPERKKSLKAPPAPMLTPGVKGGGQAMRINIRGNPERLGDVAAPGFLQLLRPAGSKSPSSFTRLDLANAIAQRDNPLTARVWVNRVWNYHFGRGIVGTLGNFGQLGDRPSHPELLDMLAVRFMESGWSTKKLHREILLSATYRLSSATDDGNASKDADDVFLWRTMPRRLDFEAWRDSMLAVSGTLDPRLGGPPLFKDNPKQTDQLQPNDPNNHRRTIYGFISRFKPSPTLTLFDFPEPNVTSDHRNVTTVPQQQLFALNSPFTLAMARAFAKRIQSETPADDARIQRAWRLAFARPPAPREIEACRAFLRAAGAQTEKMTPWGQLCHSLLTTNEFAFVN